MKAGISVDNYLRYKYYLVILLVVCQISINFTQRINIRENEHNLRGMTKLRNEINVLCESLSSGSNIILVFEDRPPFNLQKEIKIKEIHHPWDIGSSENEDCLYISDYLEKCVWKITREIDNQDKVMKWLTTDYQPWTLSVSGDGQLMLINDSSHSLMIYGSDAELIRSIRLPQYIVKPNHAVETPIEISSSFTQRRTRRLWSLIWGSG